MQPYVRSSSLAHEPHQFRIGMIFIFPTIVFYNHVMHDDINIYDIPKAHLTEARRQIDLAEARHSQSRR
jgi:hypothetical protein